MLTCDAHAQEEGPDMISYTRANHDASSPEADVHTWLPLGAVSIYHTYPAVVHERAVPCHVSFDGWMAAVKQLDLDTAACSIQQAALGSGQYITVTEERNACQH
jgi:hypothetical protein